MEFRWSISRAKIVIIIEGKVSIRMSTMESWSIYFRIRKCRKWSIYLVSYSTYSFSIAETRKCRSRSIYLTSYGTHSFPIMETSETGKCRSRSIYFANSTHSFPMIETRKYSSSYILSLLALAATEEIF